MHLPPESRERLRRWGIDPDLPRDEIVRLLTERWMKGREKQLAERRADKPVVIDMGGGQE